MSTLSHWSHLENSQTEAWPPHCERRIWPLKLGRWEQLRALGSCRQIITLECGQCQGRGWDQMKNKFVIFQFISRLLTRSVMYCYLMVWQLLCYWWTGSKRHPRHNVKFISPTHSHYRRAHRWTQVCSYCRLLVTHIYITFFHLINTWSWVMCCDMMVWSSSSVMASGTSYKLEYLIFILL